MSIESKIPAEELNIKNLNLEQPEANSTVDFDKLVSVVDWGEFINEARMEWENMSQEDKETFKLEGETAQTLYKISQLNSETSENLSEILRANESAYDTLVKEELEDGKISDGRWLENVWTAVAVKSLRPEKDLNLGLSEQVWEQMKKQLDFERGFGNYGQSIIPQMALGIRIMFPNRRKELGLEEKDWRGMEKLLEEYKKGKNWREYYLQMAYMKLLFPEHRNDFSSIVNANMPEIKAEIMDNNAKKLWDNTFDILYAVKLLSSEKVIFSDNGMEIIMSNKADFKTASNLPETKKF